MSSPAPLLPVSTSVESPATPLPVESPASLPVLLPVPTDSVPVGRRVRSLSSSSFSLSSSSFSLSSSPENQRMLDVLTEIEDALGQVEETQEEFEMKKRMELAQWSNSLYLNLYFGRVNHLKCGLFQLDDQPKTNHYFEFYSFIKLKNVYNFKPITAKTGHFKLSQLLRKEGN